MTSTYRKINESEIKICSFLWVRHLKFQVCTWYFYNCLRFSLLFNLPSSTHFSSFLFNSLENVFSTFHGMILREKVLSKYCKYDVFNNFFWRDSAFNLSKSLFFYNLLLVRKLKKHWKFETFSKVLF